MAFVRWALCALAVCCPAFGQLSLISSDARLVEAFNWAKRQALRYSFPNSAIGPWYEASLPGRNAFCMRDVAHQVTAAQLLGLAAANLNMLRRFAASIAESRDWAGYWEIDNHGGPAAADYRNDRDFWYNLPGNFVVLDACLQAYLWTADHTYVDDPVFQNFYARTLDDYIRKWDREGTGIPQSRPEYGTRGLGSFTETMGHHIKIGSDLIAAQYAALLAGARFQEMRRHPDAAHELRRRAEGLRERFNRDWWNATWLVFSTYELSDGQRRYDDSSSFFPLWFFLTEPGIKTERQLDVVLNLPSPPLFPADRPHTNAAGPNVEELSYLPEIGFRYGRDQRGYDLLLRLADAKLDRREYPEVSFSVIRTIACGLMGIEPDAAARRIRTQPHLPPAVADVTLEHVPVFEGDVSVKHSGVVQTQLVNRTGGTIEWQAAFPGRHSMIVVDGKPLQADAEAAANSVRISVQPGQTRTAAIPSPR